MITYNIYYRFQLKEPVLFHLQDRPTTHTHGPLQTKQNRFFKLKSIIDFICDQKMITLIY